MTNPIGLTHREKCDLIGNFELNCSMSQFDALAVILQQRAMDLFVAADGPAVEMRILGESDE